MRAFEEDSLARGSPLSVKDIISLNTKAEIAAKSAIISGASGSLPCINMSNSPELREKA